MFIVIGDVLDNTRACQRERDLGREGRKKSASFFHDIDRIRIAYYNSCNECI